MYTCVYIYTFLPPVLYIREVFIIRYCRGNIMLSENCSIPMGFKVFILYKCTIIKMQKKFFLKSRARSVDKLIEDLSRIHEALGWLHSTK